MTKDFLADIVSRKRREVSALKSAGDLPKRAHQIRQSAPPHRLRDALRSTSQFIKIIAEFKRASPSRGTIRGDLPPRDVARFYEKGGAIGISVLTDSAFAGSLADLVAVRAETQLSILRKDFIIDPLQIYEAACAGADAILLIAAILGDRELEALRGVAEDELGLDALMEVHNADELRRVTKAGANIIGINNRDLRTFEVSLKTSARLIAEAPDHALMISESGLESAEQLRHFRALGFDGFLIGEQLMRAPDPATSLRMLTAALEK